MRCDDSQGLINLGLGNAAQLSVVIAAASDSSRGGGFVLSRAVRMFGDAPRNTLKINGAGFPQT